jgi:hypothetical protein
MMPASRSVLLALAGLGLTLALTSSASAVSPNPTDKTCIVNNCGTIDVGLVSSGSGRITSSPAGLDCALTLGVKSGTCSYRVVWPLSVPYQSFKILFTPADSSLACDPGGACGRPGEVWAESSSLEPGKHFSTRVVFVYRSVTLTVTTSGVGTGKVTSAPAGIDCGTTCSAKLGYGTKTTLTATPDAGAAFKQWTGACNGQGATCKLTVKDDVSTNAVFDLATTSTTTTTTTTAGSTTTNATTTSTSTTTRDTSVDVDLIGARAGRTKLGARAVFVELDLGEGVSATLVVRRHGKALATKVLAKVRPGDDRLLTFVIPRRVPRGRAVLAIALRDAAGNTRKLSRTVTLGKR